MKKFSSIPKFLTTFKFTRFDQIVVNAILFLTITVHKVGLGKTSKETGSYFFLIVMGHD